ncbi:type IV pilus assembly protein PilM [Patescibacteria group bacterium]|nr:type IV pilus assembly protein PilM [Patescibacteria group bacterium]
MSALGLHLKLNGVSAVEIDAKRNSLQLVNSDYRDFSDTQLDISDSNSISLYVDKMKEFFFDNKFKTNQVICSLPQPEVFVRTIKVPPMNKKDLDNFIKYESGQYIPLPLEEVTVGYEQMPPDVTDKNKLSILLVAAKKSVVAKYIQIVKQVGLTPVAMEPESLAMTRALGFDRGEGFAELIVDIGKKETLIILAYKSFVVLTRTLPLGDALLTKTLEQTFNLDSELAEQYKSTYGMDETKAEGKVYVALKPVFDKIIEEIKKSSVFFSTHNPNVRIDKIIVSGEAALMPGLLIYMVNNFNVEVELANPWTRFSMGTETPKERLVLQKGPLYTVAVGLALRGIKK